MTRIVMLQDGHYNLQLPFKMGNVTLLDNLGVVSQGLNGLERKLVRNKGFHEQYSHFLAEVVRKGYAEKVPSHQLDRVDGRVWFIPEFL